MELYIKQIKIVLSLLLDRAVKLSFFVSSGGQLGGLDEADVLLFGEVFLDFLNVDEVALEVDNTVVEVDE